MTNTITTIVNKTKAVANNIATQHGWGLSEEDFI